jgi:predicted transcriptional regulator
MTPKPQSDMVRQSSWLSQSTLDALKRISEKQERPVGWLIRKAVEEFVAKQEKR